MHLEHRCGWNFGLVLAGCSAKTEDKIRSLVLIHIVYVYIYIHTPTPSNSDHQMATHGYDFYKGIPINLHLQLSVGGGAFQYIHMYTYHNRFVSQLKQNAMNRF